MNITTNYLAPMPGYKWATIEANVLRVGKTIAHIEVSIYDGNNLAAKGTHVKFISADEVDLWELARMKRREVTVAGRSKL
jgi:acyl-coenzyme A thioesterase PaaI-like protein